MPNRFNYRCPQCGGTDGVVIEAYVAVWVSSTGAHIIEEDHQIGPKRWNPTNPAHCMECHYVGRVENFELRNAKVIPFRRRRR
jgi:hypothetical protein